MRLSDLNMADKTYTEQGKELANEGSSYVQDKASAVSASASYCGGILLFPCCACRAALPVASSTTTMWEAWIAGHECCQPSSQQRRWRRPGYGATVSTSV